MGPGVGERKIACENPEKTYTWQCIVRGSCIGKKRTGYGRTDQCQFITLSYAEKSARNVVHDGWGVYLANGDFVTGDSRMVLNRSWSRGHGRL